MRIDLNSPKSRKALARMMIKLFDHWGLEAADRLELLGLDTEDPGILDQFRSGEAPIPETGDTMERVSCLLTVHKELRTIFPHNRDLVYRWVTNPTMSLKGKTPLYVMKVQELAGIKRVIQVLKSI